MTSDAPTNKGKHVTSNEAMLCPLPAIKRLFHFFIGPDDVVCYDVV